MQCQAEYEELISRLRAMNPVPLCHCCLLRPVEERWGSFALERGNVLMNQEQWRAPKRTHPFFLIRCLTL